MASRVAAYIAIPYFRRELPAWGKLYHKLVGKADEPCWRNAPTRVIRGKLHGYRMRLDLSDWSDRSAYFLGRYYDLDTQQAYRLLIDEGDRVMDVGANVGMMMLLAARLVGNEGRVDCVEPNPECVARLRDHVDLNGLSHVFIHEMGLADQPAEMMLRVVTNHTGSGSLAEIKEADAHLITKSVKVPVDTGDSLLERLPGPPRLIKIDIEGFEQRALLGLQRTIETHHPILMLEFVESHLARAGSSRGEVATLLSTLGYKGFAIGMRRAGLRYRLALEPLSSEPQATPSFSDTVWLHGEDSRSVRIQPYVNVR